MIEPLPTGETPVVNKYFGGPKLAITVFGKLMVRDCGFVRPVRAPLNPAKLKPAIGVAVS